MLYDYQYDIAALSIMSVLLCVFLLRNKYNDKSNKIFLLLIIFNVIASILDIISCFTISYPERFPLIFNYIISLGYLFFYNMLSIIYFAYIDAKGKVEKFKKPAQLAIIVSTLYYAITIFTSPFFHLVAYFDENLVYKHGPLMVSLQILPFIMVVWELVILKNAKRRFNFYQIVTYMTMIIGMSVAVIVPIIISRALVGQLAISIVLVFMYMVFENPAYYLYLNTQCLNQKAFEKVINKKHKTGYDIIIIDIKDFNYIKNNFGYKKLNHLIIKMISDLYRLFKKNIFCINKNKYVVISYKNELHNNIEKIFSLFNKPIISYDARYKFNINLITIYNANKYNANDMLLLIEHANNDVDSENSKKVLDGIINNITKKDSIIVAIENAIKNDSFQVFYQPIYNIKENKYKSAEALIRLFDDNLGFINPEELIVIAENNGYIDKIGEIVFEKVCKFINEQALEKLGIEYIEINLSPIQCLRKDLVITYYNIMSKYNINPNQINLEITETAQFSNDENIQENIKKFNEFGIKFSIDDYGSGFASANYLIKLPINIVKIDKEILWSAMKNDNAMIILKNTIKMIKELNYEIIVEGVETKEMANFLKIEGCDFNQGYYFSKPINENEFINFIKEKNGA